MIKAIQIIFCFVKNQRVVNDNDKQNRIYLKFI